MRLEEHAHARTGEPLARRGDRLRDLRRMVAVVVDDRHVAMLVDLEAPARAGEARERRAGRIARDARLQLERGERGPGVQAVVLAGTLSGPPKGGASRTTCVAVVAQRSNSASSSASDENSE